MFHLAGGMKARTSDIRIGFNAISSLVHHAKDKTAMRMP
jgi:hypothetical protein